MTDHSDFSETDFLRLFVKHEQALRAFARVLLPSWQAIDEVIQEASVVMWKKLGQLESADDFLPWAKVIVRFESLRMRRDFARDRHIFSDELCELLAKEAAEVPEELWAGERVALRSCLAELSPQHRELVLAPYAGDGRVTQIATQTGRTVNSLYKMLGRIREQLAKCVKAKIASGKVI